MSEAPLVGIIMGSRSDWETMRHAAETLDELGVPYETEVVSAHRTPDKLFAYADVSEPKAGDDLKVVLEDARKIAPDAEIVCEDVCGFWPGSDPELSKEVILCSAH